MPHQPKPQDPAPLDGTSPRFANAFTRRLTRLRKGEGQGPWRWTWTAGAGLTVCVTVAVLATGNVPSGTDTKPTAKVTAKAAPAASVSPSPSEAPHGPAKPVHHGHTREHRPSTSAKHPEPGESSRSQSPSGTKDQPDTPARSTAGHTPTRTSSGSGGQRSGTGGSAGSGGGTTTSHRTTIDSYQGVPVYSHASGRCITASGSQYDRAVDGTRLEIRDCVGGSWQRIDFHDGTARMFGLCMDVAGASGVNGTAIQLARCNGGWAQDFELNSAHDLVNTRIGMCVDVTDMLTANGTRLQLWNCGGTDNQKWSKR